ncbi:hypothetical protein JTE90_025601 [Oedothorax gibbosus]|uniref:Uncharacterized protein n=1 Tax=Oedothorax gibbosus TaxID=931172 RepID=A0AAV6TDL8_9ARAC|nr:hypothetical protein JTE90_025601 [Oedothorax gibbosus]
MRTSVEKRKDDEEEEIKFETWVQARDLISRDFPTRGLGSPGLEENVHDPSFISAGTIQSVGGSGRRKKSRLLKRFIVFLEGVV